MATIVYSAKDHRMRRMTGKISSFYYSPSTRSPKSSNEDDDISFKAKTGHFAHEESTASLNWSPSSERRLIAVEVEGPNASLDASIKPSLTSKVSSCCVTAISNIEKKASSEQGENGEAAKARERVLKLFSGSAFTFPDEEFPTFKEEELILGKRLGRGGFGDIFEIPMIRCAENQCSKDLERNDAVALDNAESRLFVAQHCVRASGHARYALKRIRSDINDENTWLYWSAVTDLVTETRILFHLEHPHVVKLRAIAQEANPFSGDYFIVLDRLYDTLETRLKTWKLEARKSNCLFNRLLLRPKSRKKHFEERLAAAHDLSSAVEYLHFNKHICHRDIKPENVGFDVRGDIKIFDFGMALDLSVLTPDRDGLFELSHMTGTLRWMAPEVAIGKNYNEACDVYSFTLLLWEMLALELPYESIHSQAEFIEKVFGDGQRPPLSKKWSQSLKDLFEGGWREDPLERLKISAVKNRLREELILHRGVTEDLDDGVGRRRSTYVYRRKAKAL